MRDRYREVYDSFRWDVPARFNIGTACCTRHSHDRNRVALRWEDEGGLQRQSIPARETGVPYSEPAGRRCLTT